MTDPRERVETENVEVNVLFHASDTVDNTTYWWVGMRDAHEGAVSWPELVELAQKILAADRAWKNPCGKCRFDGNASSVCRRYRDFESRGYCSHCSHDEACHARVEELTDGK